jgi:hypothetical protein
MSLNQYIAPSWQETEDTRLGWFKEQRDDGDTYLKGQRSYRDIDKNIDVIAGSAQERIPSKQSDIFINMLKRDIRENISTLSNMRPLWGYKSDNQDYAQLIAILNKMLLAWYLNTFADRDIRQALQYAGVACLGWVSPRWRNDFWTVGRGDIVIPSFGPRDVIPYQIGKDHDIQRAYVVTIVEETPLNLAITKYPTQLSKLVPDTSMPTWMRRGIRRVQKFMSPVLERFGPGRGKDTDDTGMPTVRIHKSYILDTSFNDSGKDIWMGETGTKWNYKVPAYNSDILSGQYNSAGQALYRKATIQDSMIFPLRRLAIWTNHGMLYDDTAPDWHGMVPAIPFRIDDWPWDFMGGSMVQDGDSVQRSNTRLARAIDDSANARLDPAMQYDENTISQGLMDRFNPRAPGQRIKTNLNMGDGIKPILPSSYYDVPAWITQFIDGNWEKMHYVLGTRDIQAIAKARQTSGDAMEKLMELAGPLITDMSRGMERSMRDLGEMWKCLALQYYDVRRRVQVLGKDGVTEEDFDYDPGTMVPSHLPDELALIKRGQLPKDSPSRANIVDRARAHLNSCYFHVTPNSIHQITQMTRKLLILQLFRSGFPISPWKVAEALDLENFGTPEEAAKILGMDKAPSDDFGRWMMWRKLQNELQGQPPGKGPGRPPSGQTAPTLQQKDSGTRTTVRESPR